MMPMILSHNVSLVILVVIFAPGVLIQIVQVVCKVNILAEGTAQIAHHHALLAQSSQQAVLVAQVVII